MAIALFVIARLAARLIDPCAAWLAAFACLALRGFNFQAADARPYPLGTCIAMAALWFLIRWLDRARWREAALFVVFAALLWRVQPVYWPFYLVLVAYTAARLAWRETQVPWPHALAIFAALALALAPVAIEVLALRSGARAHVIAPLPGLRALLYSLKPGLLVAFWGAGWLLSRVARWKTDARPPARSSLVLLLALWCSAPVGLFGFSWLTGVSMFVDRYYSLVLPGAVLLAVAVASRFVPLRQFRTLSAAVGVAALLLLGDWNVLWPEHTDGDWRLASRAIDSRALGPDTPVVCLSPFIEARPPVWHPDETLPAILYAYLWVYPVHGNRYLFPFGDSPQAERIAAAAAATLSSSSRFFIYGDVDGATFWRRWFQRRAELAGWTSRRIGPPGSVAVVEFNRSR
jgi:hypothetical protein